MVLSAPCPLKSAFRGWLVLSISAVILLMVMSSQWVLRIVCWDHEKGPLLRTHFRLDNVKPKAVWMQPPIMALNELLQSNAVFLVGLIAVQIWFGFLVKRSFGHCGKSSQYPLEVASGIVLGNWITLGKTCVQISALASGQLFNKAAINPSWCSELQGNKTESWD